MAAETKASERVFKIVQIGCGVVGKAYVDAYKEKKNIVIGIEANKTLIALYGKETPMFFVGDDLSRLSEIDFVMISIDTPLRDDKLDLTNLFRSLPNVATIVNNNPDVMIIIRSTVEPGTTVRYKAQLEALVNKEVKVLFQPEFLRAKTALEDARNPWHIVLGADSKTIVTKLLGLYTNYTALENITILSIEEAESMKLFHNCYNAAKISWHNQAQRLVDRINARKGLKMDIKKITEAMTRTCEGLLNPAYGTTPGHAYYGTCLPKDSKELSRLEKEYGLEAPLFTAVVQVNDLVKATDKAEVLDGDHHMAFNILKAKNPIAA
ncbi:MAG: GDP-mannose 6-dehydrogenase 2 [Harvfovirus sp.]|uniref:GDP-mannose 6-dehydrogenase 2 n=1 Tax=Harvfovirus sp. TaxID=2487768 RepID=A0A3G5A2J2_9VIRU|nr:MAG: GDP-mannose 6-dehydrogenase 2 [Harvfovirus sp.]